MSTVSRTFSVTPSPATVLDYLADFGNAEQWDPGTRTCTRTDTGPITTGSTWHNVSRIFGVTTELTYELRERTADRLVFVGTNKTATSTDTIAVAPDGTGSTLTYRSDIDLNGWARIADPLMRIAFEKLAGDTERQLRSVLNRL